MSGRELMFSVTLKDGGSMGASGALSQVSDVSLDELMGGDGVDKHLICGCRPQFKLCGVFEQDANTVEYLTHTTSSDTCADCVKVWGSTGCGVCGCNALRGCPPCLERYQRYLATTH